MLRAFVLPALRVKVVSRSLTTKVHRPPQADEGADFRPPWMYTMSRLLSYTIIPSIAVYSIFIHDFGDKDHVFQPARKWAASQKDAFFTISPAEQKILDESQPKSQPTELS